MIYWGHLGRTAKSTLNRQGDSNMKNKTETPNTTLTKPVACDRLFTREQVAEYLSIGKTLVEKLPRLQRSKRLHPRRESVHAWAWSKLFGQKRERKNSREAAFKLGDGSEARISRKASEKEKCNDKVH